MNKTIFSSLFFLIILYPVSAQKEVYFSTTKPEDIKVESMQGIEIGSYKNIENIFRPSNSYYSSTYIPITMGYFKEKRIAPSWTLTTRITLLHGFGKSSRYTYGNDSTQNDSANNYGTKLWDNSKSYYHLSIAIGIEPRWYFGYKKRYQTGKARLNSGWFLAMPVTLSKVLINTNKVIVNDDTFSSLVNYCSLGLRGTLGYRQAITSHLFLEGNCHIFNTSSSIYSLNSNIHFMKPRITLLQEIGLKVAYTFK